MHKKEYLRCLSMPISVFKLEFLHYPIFLCNYLILETSTEVDSITQKTLPLFNCGHGTKLFLLFSVLEQRAPTRSGCVIALVPEKTGKWRSPHSVPVLPGICVACICPISPAFFLASSYSSFMYLLKEIGTCLRVCLLVRLIASRGSTSRNTNGLLFPESFP